MNVYEIVTANILEKLSTGVIPWRQSWKLGAPKSLATGREYRGINVFILSSQAFSSRYWVTLKEANRLGGRVLKGSRSSPVIYWHWRTEAEKTRLIAEGKAKDPSPCIPFVSRVFNLEQVEGINRPEDDVIANCERRIDCAESLVLGMPSKPKIVQGATQRPCYSVTLDEVRIPFITQFESPDSYYLTLFHELVHSTGHPSRLSRFEKSEGNDMTGYSFEELVAEFGAAFLSALAGIDNTRVVEDSASYIDGWAQLFKKDRTVLLKAATSAQKAVDFIQGRSQEKAEAKAA